jgi:hypothetical protein
LNNVVALDDAGSFVDTSFEEGSFMEFDEGAEVIVVPVSSCSPLMKFAFSTQDANAVFIDVTYEISGETFHASLVTQVPHWSGDPRDGGEWTPEDANDPTHWSYTLVDLENLENIHAAASSWCNITSNW